MVSRTIGKRKVEREDVYCQSCGKSVPESATFDSFAVQCPHCQGII